MRQITVALLNYADDWQNCLPGLNAFGDLRDLQKDRANRGPMWKYIKSMGVLTCPVEVLHRRPPDPNNPNSLYGINFTYTINAYMTIAEQDRAGADIRGESLSKSRDPTKTILLVDENCDPRKNEEGVIVNDALFIWKDRTGDRHSGAIQRRTVVNGIKLQVTGVAPVAYLDTHMGVVPGLIKWESIEGQEIFYK